MPNFMVIKQQEDEGCDYSIGCGVALEIISAESLAAAVDALREEWSACDTGYLGTVYYGKFERGERRLKAAWVVPMTECFTLPIENWAIQFEKAVNADLEEKALREKRALLRQLQSELDDD